VDVLHPTNVTQKVQFIIEHFSKNVAHRLDGKAKAMVVTSSRAAAIRYKKAFDRYIAKHPNTAGIHSLIAFSGKMTGKQVMHATTSAFKDDVFIVDENEEFTEDSMNPDVKGQDLRLAFDRPEYRVMLVADKFQTGFDQPKLVASTSTRRSPTMWKSFRPSPASTGWHRARMKSSSSTFVNDPENVRRAFAMYDDGAQIDDVQDLNVVYEIKEQLDEPGLVRSLDLEAFKEARFKTIRDITHARSRSTRRCMPRRKDRPGCSINAEDAA
jgi:type I restriction enzyme R subunit